MVGGPDDGASPSKRDVRRWVPVLAQLLGVLFMAVGFGLLEIWAGLVVGGLGLLAAGTVAELGER
jgi:hypothetical protein